MSLEGRQKLKKVTDLTVRNVCRETVTEVEIFINAIKAFADEDKAEYIDKAYERLRNRIFDIGGEESRRLQRYLNGWEVEQKSDDLDWVEYGPRIGD